MSVSSSSWCLGRAAVCDCGTPWTFLLPWFAMREPVFRGVKPGETNQPAQFQKWIRGMKSVHHNSSFLTLESSAYLDLRKLATKPFVYYIIQPFTRAPPIELTFIAL